ncbi:hypothetical protein [Brevibacillus migulae]|uniref:hypothetical protein n=1 Tax=Brevibacillus migulae TaxID=1644114 RepID=UPI00106E8696|nr:hypothetical protein [Brevibacillus migulae]
MSKLLLSKSINISSSSSSLGISEADYYQRYLTIDGHKIASTGIFCETCLFLFEILGEPKCNSYSISNLLNQGESNISDSLVTELTAIFPNGRFSVLLLKVYPRFKKQSNVRGEYYRIGSREIGFSKKIVEYIVPFQKGETLDESTVNDYMKELEMGLVPTALAISFLDIKYPQNDFIYVERWEMSHYLLDGHHKMLAAAKAKRPITLISFLSLDRSYSDQNHIEKLLKVLKSY